MSHHRPAPGFSAIPPSARAAGATRAPVSHDLLWLLLDDETGRPLVNRQSTGLALTVAARTDIDDSAVRAHPRIPSPRRLRRRSLYTLHSTHRVRRISIRLGGVIPYAAWPTVDLSGKRAVRDRLERALFDAQPPDDATRAQIAILHTVDALGAQCPQWSHRETAYWARQFITQHDDCAQLAESLRRLDREALADTLSFGARPLFVPRATRIAGTG